MRIGVALECAVRRVQRTRGQRATRAARASDLKAATGRASRATASGTRREAARRANACSCWLRAARVRRVPRRSVRRHWRTRVPRAGALSAARAPTADSVGHLPDVECTCTRSCQCHLAAAASGHATCYRKLLTTSKSTVLVKSSDSKRLDRRFEWTAVLSSARPSGEFEREDSLADDDRRANRMF